MKKYLLTAMALLMLIAVAACNSNNNMPLSPAATPTQNENNQIDTINAETPAENLPSEELKIQIDVVTDEILSTFTNLHHVDLDVLGNGEGTNLVVWANQPLPYFYAMRLEAYWLEDMDTWGFRPYDNIGHVEVLLPGEGYVIENYMGLGTMPHRGIGFFDSEKRDTRVFFFQENHAYPEHGGQWILHEIEADRLRWTWTPPDELDPSNEGDYSIIINGEGFASTGGFYAIAGEQQPTHVTMAVLWALGLDAMQGGSQISLQHNGEGIGVALSVTNYLAFGADRVAVGINDTFMADDGYFTQYMPISLLRHLGFDVYFEGDRVHIVGQLNVAVNPHPLATALQNFIDNAEGRTKAFVTHIGGVPGVVAIEFVDDFFAEATVFVFTGLELIHREIGSIEGFPFSIGNTSDLSESLVKMTGDGGNWSYTTFAIATNPTTITEEIIYHSTIYAESESLGVDGNFRMNYYRFNGGWLEGIEGGRHSITEEEFNEIRSGMGEWITSWRDMWDSTESILTWVSSTWR